MHAVARGRQKRALRTPGTGIAVACQPPRGFWELNLDPLQEQPVLRTAGETENVTSGGNTPVVSLKYPALLFHSNRELLVEWGHSVIGVSTFRGADSRQEPCL